MPQTLVIISVEMPHTFSVGRGGADDDAGKVIALALVVGEPVAVVYLHIGHQRDKDDVQCCKQPWGGGVLCIEFVRYLSFCVRDYDDDGR